MEMKRIFTAGIIGLVLMLLLIVSCEKEHKEAWVSLRNETGYDLQIKLFPSEKANGFRTDEALDTTEYGKYVQIYADPDEDIDPSQLLGLGYDSIVIYLDNPESDTITWTKSGTHGYSLNPFLDTEAYILEKAWYDFPTNFSRNHTLVFDYVYEIRMDNLVLSKSF